MRAWAVVLAAGLLGSSALAQGVTTIVPRTTITIDEQPAVVQPGPALMGPAAPDPRRRGRPAVAEPYGPPPPPPFPTRPPSQQTSPPPSGPAAADRPPAQQRAQGPRRPTNGYSSFLTGPIDLTRPPVPQE